MLNKGKHIVQEIDGVLCTIVESGVSQKRMQFLKAILEYNRFEVKVSESPAGDEKPATFTLGVTDLVFNPVIAVYEKALKGLDGKVISPTLWNQEPEIDQLPYFDYREKNAQAENTDDFLPNPWAYRTI